MQISMYAGNLCKLGTATLDRLAKEENCTKMCSIECQDFYDGENYKLLKEVIARNSGTLRNFEVIK